MEIEETKEYVKKRNEILINFENMSDREVIFELFELNRNNLPSSPEVARIGLHKARLYACGVPDELKEKSKQWLEENGYSCEIY